MAYYEVNKKPRLTFPTLTDSIVTFNSQYAGLPLKSHVVDVSIIQAGSGTPTPANPRPFSYFDDITISHSDSDTSNPNIYVVSVGGGVYYYGPYDAITGLFNATHVHLPVDGNTTTIDSGYNYGATYRVLCRARAGENPKYISGNQTPRAVGDQAVCTFSAFQSPNSWSGDMAVWPYNTSSTSGIFIMIPSSYGVTSNASAKTYFQNNPMNVIYELNTPITLQLAPCPIDTLIGENNIWADTGDTTLQYMKWG